MKRKLIIPIVLVTVIALAVALWLFSVRLLPSAAMLPTLAPLPSATVAGSSTATVIEPSVTANGSQVAAKAISVSPNETSTPDLVATIDAKETAIVATREVENRTPTPSALTAADATATSAAVNAAIENAVAATIAAQRAFTPTPCPDTSPYGMDPARMARLGCPASGFVPSRFVVTQRFNNGFMIVFDDATNSDFKKLNQKRKFYAFADDGRAWRVYFDREDVPQTTSSNPADWYSCDKRAGRPENNGIPWRGFGLVWCGSSAIKRALGSVRSGAAEIKETAAFQSYTTGRVFTLNGRTYVVYLDWQDGVDDHLLTGTWELR